MPNNELNDIAWKWLNQKSIFLVFETTLGLFVLLLMSSLFALANYQGLHVMSLGLLPFIAICIWYTNAIASEWKTRIDQHGIWKRGLLGRQRFISWEEILRVRFDKGFIRERSLVIIAEKDSIRLPTSTFAKSGEMREYFFEHYPSEK